MITINLLSLDLSTKSTGWAIFIDNQLSFSGIITTSSTNVIKRIEKITNELFFLLNSHSDIDTVVCEEVLPTIGHNSNTNVWKALTWLQASVTFMIHDNFPKIKREFIMPNSWRANIGIKTGKNQTREALKKADVEFVKEKFNKETVNDDEADAICLGLGYLNKQDKNIIWE